MTEELWLISDDVPENSKGFEGFATQGNPYYHLRASLEEGLSAAPQDEEYMRLPANVTLEKPRHPRSKSGFYIPGITGRHPLLGEVIVNLPSPIVLRLKVADEVFDMDSSDYRNYQRQLDARDGVLERSFDWHTKSGTVLHCVFTRAALYQQSQLLWQSLQIRADQDCLVEVYAEIDGAVKTNGYNHFETVETLAGENWLGLNLTTDTQGQVAMLSLLEGAETFAPDGKGLCARLTLSAGVETEVKRLTQFTSTMDSHFQPLDQGRVEAAKAALKDRMSVFPELLVQHQEAWAELWSHSFVEIEGDDQAQKQVNMAVYHLLRTAHPGESRMAVCAKGFAGEAYFGHFFWDSEVYLLPFYLYTQPEAARSLTEYRLRTLPGAIQNAKSLGYPGAKYAWEASSDGTEQCPNWQYCDHEIHINADVVFGLWHDFCASHDLEFLRRSLPVLIETSRYWLARVTWHKDGEISLDGVMGPDEYICFCKNNAYTNFMVRYALEITLKALELAGQTEQYLSYQEVEQIRQVIEKLPAPKTDEGLVWQCEGFADYAEPEFDRLWPDRSRPFGTFISQERNYRIKALKQADVLMLPFLFPSLWNKETLAQNYDYYEPYTTHDSSLSYVVHAALAARLGRKEQAEDFFVRAGSIDFDGGAAEGVHIANCGGLWQAVVMGFAGFLPAYASQGQEPSFAPALPAHWQKVSFPLLFKGRRYQVTVTAEEVVCQLKEEI